MIPLWYSISMASLEEEIQQSSFPNERMKAQINLMFTAQCIGNRVAAILKPYKLTPEQFNVLRILRGSHPQSMCQKNILSRMIARNSNVTLIVKKLVQKKWIQVIQSERDRREYVINITNEGLELLKEVDKEFEKHKNMADVLSESEAFHLNALLDKMRS